jgi:Na+/H+-dicarboxylate symporter
MKIWQKVLVAMVLGSIVGYLFNIDGPLHIDGKEFFKEYILPFGNTFMDLIKLVIVPLIFFVIVTGITGMTDKEAFKRVGIKAAIVFLSTAIVAVLIGIAFGLLFQPGVGVTIPHATVAHNSMQQEGFSLAQILSIFVASNIIGAMTTNDHLVQVVFFAIIFGITINTFGEKMQPLKDICKLSSQIFFKMIGAVMNLAPYGVFALIAPMVASQGLELVKNLSFLVLTVFSALFLQYLLFSVYIIVFGKISPWPFYRKMVEVQIVAFSTSSSKATLPTAMRVLQERMGVSITSTEFLLPLAASINMVGISIYLGICSLFVAQASHIQLTLSQYFILILTTTIGAIGGAGIPGGSIVMMGMVFNSLGLPLEGVALILGVDRILDMLRTVLNLSCDCMMTMLIDKSEGTFSEEIYNNKNI